MDTRKVGGSLYARMVRMGASRLFANRTAVNDLNVFPIPDGDTGDNMYMTIRAGSDAALKTDSLSSVASAVSSGMLLGARGNSGVILSRIFAGIAKGLEGLQEADLQAFDAAMRQGVEESYRAVSVPVEGTILTVFKDAVNAASGSGATSLEEYFRTLCTEMEASLERTPELLQVLADAGVVDSGGAGLVYIADGMRSALDSSSEDPFDSKFPQDQKTFAQVVNLDAFGPDSELEFGYCTEFLLRLQTSKVDLEEFDETVICDYLNSVGESVVCFRDGSIVKVHVHTRKPGDILNHCQQWGEYLTLKIENMTLQHKENDMDNKVRKGPRRKTAVVTVASGKGMVRMFSDMGASFVIEGGQTMNPSADSFIKAFRSVNADNVYVLPNNSNIVLTARQAAQLYQDSNVCVIPTETIGAGYAVLGSIDFSARDPEGILAEAEEIISSVVTGTVSRSIRDTATSTKGDYLGFSGKKILSSSADRTTAALELCESLQLGDYDVALVLKGADVPSAEADRLCDALKGKYRLTEIIMNDGGQPVFDYIIILE